MAGEDRDIHDNSEIAVRLSPFDPFLYGFFGIRVFSCISSGDHDQALRWAEKAANCPGAPVVVELMALAASTLAENQTKSAYWYARAKQRKEQPTREYFFSALPFQDGIVRQRVSDALARHDL